MHLFLSPSETPVESVLPGCPSGMVHLPILIAIEVGVGAILTFDQEQKALAEATGTRVLILAVRRGW